jgi:NAD-dependent deacetylase
MESTRWNCFLLDKKMKKKLIFLSGAGVSAESGIATFRDSDGLWEQYRIEEVATPEAWEANPELVIDFYNQRRRNVRSAEPNAAHYAIASLQEKFDVSVITQNIDDLHERAGVKNVMHLHGEIFKKRNEHDENQIQDCSNDQPLKDFVNENSRWRPHIVWFGEQVPMLVPAMKTVHEADLFVVIGTSLLVYPAASLVEFTPPHSINYLIDPNPPAHVPKHFSIIQETATKGMEKLAELLMNI